MKKLIFLLCTILLSINSSAQIVNVQPILLFDKVLNKKDTLSMVIEIFDKDKEKITKSISKKVILEQVTTILEQVNTEELAEVIQIPKGSTQENVVIGVKVNALVEKVDSNTFNLTYDLKFGDLTDTEIVEANIEGSLNFKVTENQILFENNKKRITLRLNNE